MKNEVKNTQDEAYSNRTRGGLENGNLNLIYELKKSIGGLMEVPIGGSYLVLSVYRSQQQILDFE